MVKRLLIYLATLAGIAAFSGLFILIFGNSIEISCARAAGSAPGCRITKALLGRVQVSSRDVLGVTDIRMDESCDDGCSYRAVLVTGNGDQIPVNEVYTDREIVTRQMDAFSTFIHGSAVSFEYSEPVQWWVIALVGGMDLIGMIAVAVSFLSQARGR